MILLDTDHLSVLINNKYSGHEHLFDRLATSGDRDISTTVVSVEEECRGWLAYISRAQTIPRQVSAYARLAELFSFLGSWNLVLFDERAAIEFTRLRQERIRIGTQDLKIAAIALVNDAVLLSANLRDFQRIPGLRVENWLE